MLHAPHHHLYSLWPLRLSTHASYHIASSTQFSSTIHRLSQRQAASLASLPVYLASQRTHRLSICFRVQRIWMYLHPSLRPSIELADPRSGSTYIELKYQSNNTNYKNNNKCTVALHEGSIVSYRIPSLYRIPPYDTSRVVLLYFALKQNLSRSGLHDAIPMIPVPTADAPYLEPSPLILARMIKADNSTQTLVGLRLRLPGHAKPSSNL